MKESLFYILFFSLSISACNNASKETKSISNDFKLEFLKSVLNDTTELQIISSKNELVSNYHQMSLPDLTFHHNSSKESISHVMYISNKLNVHDTPFIEQQIKDNGQFDLTKLSEYGFKIFDQKLLIDRNLSRREIWDIADKFNEGTNNTGFLKISKPIFNKDKNLAYLMLERGYSGQTLILEKVKNKWQVKHIIDEWEE